MDGLPQEMLWYVLERTDHTTLVVLACINRNWNETSKAIRTSWSASCEKRRRCRTVMPDGSAGRGCMLPRRCAADYAKRLVHQRRWSVFAWMADRMGPFEGENDVDEVACIAAAADGDVERLASFTGKGNRYRLNVKRASFAAGRYGHQNVLEWLEHRGTWWDARACNKAIKGGHVALATWMLARIKAKSGKFRIFVPWAAARCGWMDLLRELAREDPHCLRDTKWAHQAAKGGRIDVLEWLDKHGCQFGQSTSLRAAKRGHLATVQWCQRHFSCWSECDILKAAKHDHMHIVQWMWAQGKKGAICMPAAETGNLDMLQWAWAHGCCCQNAKLHTRAAAARGHLHVLQWCAARDEVCSTETLLERASKNGHVHVLEWVLEQWQCNQDSGGNVYDIPLIVADGARVKAAANGHLDVLEWLDRNGLLGRGNWETKACTEAAAKGHLHVLAWLRARGAAWEESACCEAAAARGDVDMLEWLRNAGCTYDAKTCARAIVANCPVTLDWVRAHGAPWDARVFSAVAARGESDALNRAYALGCPWDEGTCATLAYHGSQRKLAWARSRGCPWDERTATIAARRRHLKLLQWALNQGCPWDSETLESLGLDADGQEISTLMLIGIIQKRLNRRANALKRMRTR